MLRITLLLLGIILPNTSWSACPPISVSIVKSEPPIVVVEEAMPDTITPTNKTFLVRGKHTSNMSTRGKVEQDSVTRCVTEVNVRVVYEATITLNNKYKKNNRCYREIIDHEMKHDEDYRKIIKKYHAELESLISANVNNLRIKTVKSVKAELEKTLNIYFDILQDEEKRMSDEFHEKNEWKNGKSTCRKLD